ncbi:hypothetical protein HYH03_010115 [Edaphochlamys debaryana]|uniref:Thioredoxin domain-containing protein n=1 Tax=Edaphochlamys debaryana TaxID=47281 RepID=A0A836BXT4_9CHLO|nr:hypothetical protein HYH03_010115 [Edaphochlamys debaryana]|eukprot:KAG2491544.1 hypothetical protein HYH03_010115 [Edaphochlamys debaryana]
MLALSSTTSTQLADVPTSEPTILARTLVGAAVAFSAIYALLSPATSAPATVSFPPPSLAGGPAPPPLPSPLPATASAAAAPASPLAPAAFVAPTRAHPSYPSLRLLRTPDQFDAFVLAANRAGYLAVVLFHAPWCEASGRMEAELNRLSRLFTSRRIVFARVDCAMKARRSGSSSPGVSPTASVDDQGNLGAAAGGFGGGALSLGLQRCDLTQLHRIHKTPTVRMYYSNNCVDEVIGCRPIEFRQACSDVCFKFKL